MGEPTNDPPQNPPASFPAPSCHVRSLGAGAYYDCLNLWSFCCPHAISFGEGHFCGYQKTHEIPCFPRDIQPDL